MQITAVPTLDIATAKPNRIRVQEHIDHACLCKLCGHALVTAGSKCQACGNRALPKRRKK